MINIIQFGFSYSCMLTILICSITVMKKCLFHKLTPKAHYYLWFLLLFCFFSPLIPNIFLSSNHFVVNVKSPVACFPVVSSAEHTDCPLTDFALTIHTQIPKVLYVFLLLLWGLGAAVMLLRIFYALHKLHCLYRQASLPADPFITDSLCKCRQRLKMCRPVRLRISNSLKGPATMGIFYPCILLPPGQNADLPYILLHELVHCKYRDTLLNFLMQIFLALNWYNPFVWYAIKQMEADRELSCDSFVLEILCEEERKSYGLAILNCAAGRLFPAVNMKPATKSLYRRMEQIADFKVSRLLYRKIGILIFGIMLSGVAVLSPSVYSIAEPLYIPDPNMNIVYEDLSSYFGSLNGSFVMYDLNKDHYTVYNKKEAVTRVSPNSTCKIYSALLALESGFQEARQQTWDGTSWPFPAWNRHQTLTTAMQNSVNWYFQELDKKSGKEKLQRFYHRIDYGNCRIRGDISSYWMESSLKISPLEQVLLLADFYENRWNFQENSINAVKNALQIREGFFGKTGTGMIDGKSVNGWFIGYTKTPSGPCIFALNLHGTDGASGAKASETVQKILTDRGLL